jgi:glycosyltransferase involved in cell wall biosynthesis
MPLFSILIPTHNHGPLITVPVASIYEQTLQDFEILIVGEGGHSGDSPGRAASRGRDT